MLPGTGQLGDSCVLGEGLRSVWGGPTPGEGMKGSWKPGFCGIWEADVKKDSCIPRQLCGRPDTDRGCEEGRK